MSANSRPPAAFVRDFFVFLERNGYAAAVLHGWSDQFEGILSDIDFTIEPAGFQRIATLVNSYCEENGWRLCQILRHEPTAAFCVCSSIDDPDRSVALDACSDYRREGVLLMTSGKLLKQRVKLPWGAYRLATATELEYRVLKAAAKNKDAAGVLTEFSGHPPANRNQASDSLTKNWQVSTGDESEGALAAMQEQLQSRFIERRSRLNGREISRIFSRLLHPTGMLIVTGEDRHEEIRTGFSRIFLPLHFRSAASVDRWRPATLVRLIRTTLLFAPSSDDFRISLVPRDCLFTIANDEPLHEAVKRFARHLEQRTQSREGSLMSNPAP